MCTYTNLHFNIANIQKKDDNEKKGMNFCLKMHKKLINIKRTKSVKNKKMRAVYPHHLPNRGCTSRNME